LEQEKIPQDREKASEKNVIYKPLLETGFWLVDANSDNEGRKLKEKGGEAEEVEMERGRTWSTTFKKGKR